MILSDKSKYFPPTISRQLFMLAKKYSEVIDFTLGDPNTSTPEAICEKAFQAVRSGYTHYTENAGMPELRDAIAEIVSRKSGKSYSSCNVAVTNGSTEAIYLALLSIVNAGDEVMIIAPYWAQYENMVKLAGGVPIIVDRLNSEFEPDMHELEARITTRTKAIIVNSPNNPSGHVYGLETIMGLAELVTHYNLYLFSDEVYDSFVYLSDYPRPSKFCPQSHLVHFNSCSKTYAMTGWRLGYVVADEPLIAAVTKLQQNMSVCASSMSQYAAFEALRNTRCREEVFRKVSERRSVLLNALRSVRDVSYKEPEGAIYVFVNIGADKMSSITFCKALLEQERVAAVPGIAFGRTFDQYIRLAYTCDAEKIVEGVARMEHFIKKNNG